jgi:hypothetical protein
MLSPASDSILLSIAFLELGYSAYACAPRHYFASKVNRRYRL